MIGRRAWETRLGSIVSIVAASTRARARFVTWQAAKEAYAAPSFGSIKVRRAPEHDAWALGVREGRIVAPEHTW